MKKYFFLFTLALCTLCSCQSINHSLAEINVPHKTIFLSFDDGPNPHNNTTGRLLDILKKYDIQAMFSLMGTNTEYAPELVRRIHDEGHIIINHGYSDRWNCSMNKKEFRDNLLKGDAAISAALGYDTWPRLYRPHGGFYRLSQEKIWQEEGYTQIACNIRAYDAVMAEEDRDRVIRTIIRKTEKQGAGIILLHDTRDSNERMREGLKKRPLGSFNRSWIPDAVETIILELREKGYNFEPSFPENR